MRTTTLRRSCNRSGDHLRSCGESDGRRLRCCGTSCRVVATPEKRRCGPRRVATVAGAARAPGGAPPALACGQRAREEPVSPRTVLRPYLRLFAVPGAAAFSLAGWLGRLPASTAGLGTVLLVSARSGSYGLAGAISGTLALAFALASPAWARAADRRGQGVVLRVSMTAFLLTGLAFVAVVQSGAPVWSWFVLAAAAGAAAPTIGSMVRTRWSHALPDPGQRQTAFAFES